MRGENEGVINLLMCLEISINKKRLTQLRI